MKTKLIALAFFASLNVQAAGAQDKTEAEGNALQAEFGRYHWDEAHEVAVMAEVRQCESLKGAAMPLTKTERDKWSDWITENHDPGWTKVRNNPNVEWKFAAVRCMRGGEEVIRLLWAVASPFGLPGILKIMGTQDKAPAIVITKETDPMWGMK